MDVGFLEFITFLLGLIIIYFLILCIYLIKFSDVYPVIIRTENEKLFFDSSSEKSLPFPSLNDPWSVHLSVIVPAYNEAERLPPMLDECLHFLDSRQKVNSGYTYEVIVVSDGSRDQTVEIALQYSKKYGSDVIRVLNLETNRGKGEAVRLGMLSSRGAVLLFADADGATKFADLAKLELKLQELTQYNYLSDPEKVSLRKGLVCGSRAHLEESDAVASRSPLRNLLMHAFHALVRFTSVRTIQDTQCGFKLMSRVTSRQLFESLHVQRWAFDVELLYMAEELKTPMAEVDVNWTEIEGSKIVPVFSWIQMGCDLIMIWLHYRIGAWKIAAARKV